MEKPLRVTLAQTVCNKLQEAIENNKWKYTLPGIRFLCEEMQVSKQTMMQALRLLEKSGYVEQVSAGKPRNIVARRSKAGAEASSGQKSTKIIASIIYTNYEELNDVDQKFFEQLQKLIYINGFGYKSITFKDIITNAGAPKIESIVGQNPADVYLVAGASPECKKVLMTLDIAIVYVGGDHVEGCAPIVGFSFTEICKRAVDYLISLGHTKISIMLAENFNRKDRSESQAESKVRELFASLNIPFSTYNCPRWGKTTSEYYEALEQLFAITPPTAILLGDVAQMPRLASFLISHGLRYPDDISIILLEQSSSILEYRPKLSYIDKPSPALAKLAFKEIKSLFNHSSTINNELSIANTKLILQDSIKALPH